MLVSEFINDILEFVTLEDGIYYLKDAHLTINDVVITHFEINNGIKCYGYLNYTKEYNLTEDIDIFLHETEYN